MNNATIAQVEVTEKHIKLDHAINRVANTAERLNDLLCRVYTSERIEPIETDKKQAEPSLSDILENGTGRLYASCDRLDKIMDELRIVLFD